LWIISLLLICLAIPSRAALKEGDPLPALDAYKLEGKLPADLKGKVLLLDFWASWCGPCKNSFPAMNDLHKQYADKGLTIIAVSVDEKRDDMDRFLKSLPASFAVVRDAAHKLVAMADVPTMPTSFLIDRSGKVRFVHKGFRGDETVKQYRAEIDTLLAEKEPK
jgi:thiol-disulfide isomerase/thioredoxin